MTKIKQLINTFFINSYSEDIRIKFYKWLSDPYKAEEKEKHLKSIWDELRVTPDASTLDSLSRLEQRLNFDKPKPAKETPVTYLFIRKISRIAAIFILPILASLITYHFTGKEQAPEAVTFSECFVPYGEMRNVLLPDSTYVTINSGSILIYPDNPKAGERYVYLNGEAFFDVKKKGNNPFIVKIDGHNVEVLGTKFNVSAYSDDPLAKTTLKEGKVKINFTDDNLQPVLLSPNDQLSYNKANKAITRTQVDAEDIAVWRNGHFIFQGASIHDILRSFERRYNITVYLNSNRFDKDKIRVKFIHGETLEESFNILKHIVPNLKYEINGTKVYVH